MVLFNANSNKMKRKYKILNFKEKTILTNIQSGVLYINNQLTYENKKNIF